MPGDREIKNHFASCIVYKTTAGIETLLIQPVGKGRKRWAFPEIEVDRDEDMADAIRKELSEELGVGVATVDYLGFVDYPRGRLHCYFSKVAKSATPQIGHLEVRDAQFFPLDKAMGLVDKRQLQLLNALHSTLAFYDEIA